MRRLLLSFASLLLVNSLAHAEEPKGCTYVEIGKLPIRYVGLGLEPATDATVEGKPATMLVDTGAYDTQLTMNGVVRRDLGLHMTGEHAEGFGGSSRIYSTRLSDFAIGPVRSKRSVNMGVIGDGLTAQAYDGIVGSPFLLQADLEVNLHDKQLRFFRPLNGNCSKAELAIWPEASFSLPTEHGRSDSPNPHFTVTVNGKELDAIIDTGAHRSLISRLAAERLGIDVKGPDVKPAGASGGVGGAEAPMWLTTVKSVQIGNETIHDVELPIVDPQGGTGAEVFLGQDFLRAHKVLFAMSQKKLYMAYLGGDVFMRGVSGQMEPWKLAEAEGGNPDAQYAMAMFYGAGRGVERSGNQAEAWLHKAAASGEPHANLMLGRRDLQAGRPADAIPKLRSALDQLPAERFGALWLYEARVKNGETELARTELAASVKRQHNDDWPAPILDYYLGNIDGDRLLALAGKDGKAAHARTCTAKGYIAELYGAKGDKEKADALMANVRAECRAAPASAPAKAP